MRHSTLWNSGAVNIEELITKAVTSAVAETVKVMIPLIEKSAPKPDYSENLNLHLGMK